MRSFADTSFLCALYREQDNSLQADSLMRKIKASAWVSALVIWEFRQASRFQVFRHEVDRTKGFSRLDAERMMVLLNANVQAGVLTLATVEWPDVHSLAEKLSAQYTMKGGHRPMDILHLATAQHLKVDQFLTFDLNQTKLARAEGLRVPV